MRDIMQSLDGNALFLRRQAFSPERQSHSAIQKQTGNKAAQ